MYTSCIEPGIVKTFQYGASATISDICARSACTVYSIKSATHVSLNRCSVCVLVLKQSDRIKQRLPDIFSVSVPQTRPTELTLNPPTVLAAAACLGVNSFLTALMTCGALEKNQTK